MLPSHICYISALIIFDYIIISFLTSSVFNLLICIALTNALHSLKFLLTCLSVESAQAFCFIVHNTSTHNPQFHKCKQTCKTSEDSFRLRISGICAARNQVMAAERKTIAMAELSTPCIGVDVSLHEFGPGPRALQVPSTHSRSAAAVSIQPASPPQRDGWPARPAPCPSRLWRPRTPATGHPWRAASEIGICGASAGYESAGESAGGGHRIGVGGVGSGGGGGSVGVGGVGGVGVGVGGSGCSRVSDSETLPAGSRGRYERRIGGSFGDCGFDGGGGASTRGGGPGAGYLALRAEAWVWEALGSGPLDPILEEW